MAEEQSSRKPLSEIFELRPLDLGDKNAFSVNGTNLNSLVGSHIVREANKAKQVPCDFKGKNGNDIELVDSAEVKINKHN